MTTALSKRNFTSSRIYLNCNMLINKNAKLRDGIQMNDQRMRICHSAMNGLLIIHRRTKFPCRVQ